jgi:hypothetical protein
MTSAWKPFRRASKSFALNMVKPSFVARATGWRYMLTVILALVGAAASAIMFIAIWGAGAPILCRWRRQPLRLGCPQESRVPT